MKKQIIHSLFYVLIISFLFSSCNHFNGYTINGKIKNAEGLKVYLEDIADTAPVVIDTTTIKNNSFQLKNYSTKGIYRLRLGDETNKSIFLYLQEKDHITINADFKKLIDYKVEGSNGSFSIQQLSATSKMRFEELDSTFSHLKNASDNSKDSIQSIFSNQKKDYIQFIKNFVENESNNYVACFALNYLGPMMQEEVPFLVDITDKLHTAEPDSKYINMWFKQMQQYRDAMMAESEIGIALNSQAPNIILQNPNGDTIQLNSLKGKYVLLDFWASWCQPCRMENPNVVKLYKKYHANGFEIFSVSLDANIDQWKKAIEKDGLIWKNHGCDFGGWNSAAAQAYSVHSIPSTFLLNKDGIVIAKNLRANELALKLAEIFSLTE